MGQLMIVLAFLATLIVGIIFGWIMFGLAYNMGKNDNNDI